MEGTFGPQGPSGWNIKYFKGLGTSTSTELKITLKIKRLWISFIQIVVMIWLTVYLIRNEQMIEKSGWKIMIKTLFKYKWRSVNYEDFINQELIHFSTYDCARSIPNMVDGLKISLRKILYSAFKRKLNSEIKVAQFSGYVSEHSAYHHGEASLNGAIVNMAQNFVGSNNINLLEPNGQFGTRLQGGDDSASERYIFTLLNPLTRCIFPEQMTLSYII